MEMPLSDSRLSYRRAVDYAQRGEGQLATMTSAVLDEIEARGHLTIAEVSRARGILRHPRSPRQVERAWRVVATLRALLAYAQPERIESLGSGPEGLAFVTDILQLTSSKVRDLLGLATSRGLSTQSWFLAMAEATDALADVLEALHLSQDPEMRAAIEAALTELDATRATRTDAPPPDWRAALAKMSD